MDMDLNLRPMDLLRLSAFNENFSAVKNVDKRLVSKIDASKSILNNAVYLWYSVKHILFDSVEYSQPKTNISYFFVIFRLTTHPPVRCSENFPCKYCDTVMYDENRFVLIGLETTDFLGSLKDFLFLIVP